MVCNWKFVSMSFNKEMDLHCRKNTRTRSSFPAVSCAIFPLRFRMNTSAPARTASSINRRSFLRAASCSRDVPVSLSR